MDELYGFLKTYELRLGIDNLPKGEATFKVIKKTNQKQLSQTNHDKESDEEEANFVKKLQKGSGKYKGKLPFKCFNCGRIGYFQAKCTYHKEESKDEDEKIKQYKKEGKFHYKKITKEKRTFAQNKKTTVHLRLVMMKSFFYVLKSLMRWKKLSIRKSQKMKQRLIWKNNYSIIYMG